mgnify:CR=1 FL=1
MNTPDFWNDLELSQEVNREVKSLKTRLETYNWTKARLEDTDVLIELGQEMEDPSTAEEVRRDVEQLEKDVERMRLSTLLKGEYDANNAIVSLKECDWSSDVCSSDL